MKKINKIILSLIISFIFINNVNASFTCGDTRENIHEESEASSAGFKANMPGCYTWTFTGDYQSLGGYKTWMNAAEVANEFKLAFYSIDGKSLHTTHVPICTGEKEKAHIDATVKCTYTQHHKPTYETKAVSWNTENSHHKTSPIPYSTKDVTGSSNPTDTIAYVTCGNITDRVACNAVDGCVWKASNGNQTDMKTHQNVAVVNGICSGTAKCPTGYKKNGTTCYECSSGSPYKVGDKIKCITCPASHNYDTESGKCKQKLSCATGWQEKDGVCWQKALTCPSEAKGYVLDSDDSSKCKGEPYCSNPDDGWERIGMSNKCERYICNTGFTLSGNKTDCYRSVTVNDQHHDDVGKTDLQETALEIACNKTAALSIGGVYHGDTGGMPVAFDVGPQKFSVDPCKCDIDYSYECPTYKCDTEVKTIDTCTPKFKTADGKTAYCANPSQPFSSRFLEDALYQVDKSFNVRECASSYSTIECGYANILLEGKWINKEARTTLISDNAIELALRLWGVHTDRKGFTTFGLSNRRNTDCQKSMWYRVWEGNITNVYKYTYDYMKEHFFELAGPNVTYDVNYYRNRVNQFSITCVKSGKQPQDMVAVACGSDNVYKQAIGLFFNTLRGNKYMQDHLTELYGGEPALPPEGVYYKTDERGSYVEIVYNEEEFAKVVKEYTEYERTYTPDVVVKCDELNPSNPHYKKIKPYCEPIIELVNASNQVINPTTDKGAMQECYLKYNSCRRRVTLAAICDIVDTNKIVTTIRTYIPRKNSGDAVRIYYSCENPDGNQMMLAYSDYVSNPSPTPPEIDVTDYPVTNYICSGTCGNFGVRSDVHATCAASGNYDGAYSSTIKDPSLRCILNMKTQYGKDLYDYSDHFKVNKKLCRIYCSDQVEYYLADKKRAVSGRTFKYDIEINVHRGGNIFDFPLTSMIKEKRTCVSEIYYNNLIPDPSDFMGIYGLKSEEVSNIKNFKDLWNVLKARSDKEGQRAENLNQILYDLYNCNLYDQSEFNSSKIKTPQESKTGNLRENILTQYGESNNYGLTATGGCQLDLANGINTCIKEKDIVYNFGQEPDGKKVEIKSQQKVNTNFRDIAYCTGSECFSYDKDNDAGSYVYPKAGESSQTNRIIGNNTVNYSLSGKVKEWFGNEATIKVPTNDYVVFEIETDIGFYNASEFQVEPLNARCVKKGTTTEACLTLGQYEYPVHRNAYNMGTPLGNGYSRNTIVQEFEKMATFFRRLPYDEFTSAVNSAMKFTCYVDVKAPLIPPPHSCNDLLSCALYRNVDPADLFPRYESIPANWDTVEGRKAKEQIESTAGDLQTTNDLLEYRITLSPTQIKSIKEYNKNSTVSYLSEGFVSGSCEIVDNQYAINCKSPFMKLLRESNTYGTLDPSYSDGVSAYNRRMRTGGGQGGR